MRRTAHLLIGVAAAALVMVLTGTASATSAWTLDTVPLPAGANGGYLTAVSCPASGDCVAAGPFGIKPPSVERWNGSTWKSQILPVPPGQNAAQVDGISCASATACTATGYYVTGAGEQVMMAEHWAGGAWTTQAVPEPSGPQTPGGVLAGVSCPGASNCTAAGYYYANGPGTQVPLAEHWTGTAWQVQVVPLPAGATFGVFTAVSCPAAGNCTAAGYAGGAGTEEPLAEHWNGRSWTVEATQPAPGGVPGFFAAVSCRSLGGHCMAVGGAGTLANTERPLAEYWNGSTWTAEATPLPSAALAGALNGVSCPTTECTAAGWWSNSTARTAGHTALAEVWDGSAWHVQSTAFPPSRKTFNAISCVGARVCAAVGVTEVKTSTYLQPLAETG